MTVLDTHGYYHTSKTTLHVHCYIKQNSQNLMPVINMFAVFPGRHYRLCRHQSVCEEDLLHSENWLTLQPSLCSNSTLQLATGKEAQYSWITTMELLHTALEWLLLKLTGVCPLWFILCNLQVQTKKGVLSHTFCFLNLFIHFLVRCFYCFGLLTIVQFYGPMNETLTSTMC